MVCGAAIRGTVAGLYSTVASLGILFVTFAGGQLLSGLGHSASFIMMGLLNALLLDAALLVRRTPFAGAARMTPAATAFSAGE